MDTFGPEDADAWYERNKHKLGTDHDPVMQSIEWTEIEPKKVFEFGCANGWRLDRFYKAFKSECWGSELSPVASADAAQHIKINQEPDFYSCDLVIMGFCLYLVRPISLFCWADHADSLLKEDGHLVVYDFLPEHPYSRIFEHNKELLSRKMDHAKLWLAHPAYSMVRRDIYGEGDDRTHVTILKKNMANAFPLEG